MITTLRGCGLECEVARRVPRYQFVADVELADVQVGIRLVARTKTLGRFGCGIDTSLQIAKGTSIRIKLYHRGAEVKALGRVVYSGSSVGMGIEFTNVDRENERILELWIEELVSTPAR